MRSGRGPIAVGIGVSLAVFLLLVAVGATAAYAGLPPGRALGLGSLAVLAFVAYAAATMRHRRG